MTLENESLRSIVRDLQFHHDPVGEYFTIFARLLFDEALVALQSMVITKQQRIGGEGRPYFLVHVHRD